MTAIRLLFALVATVSVQSVAVAQPFPNKFVKLVAGFGTGGIGDIMARGVAAELSTIWKQSVVVENRVGGTGTLATEAVRQAPADGYTILQAETTMILTNEFLREKKRDYQFDKIMTPVRSIISNPAILAVNPNLPVKTVPEFIALAKASPGKFNYGSFGAGGIAHIDMEAFATQFGIKLTHVPYKGATPMVAALMADEVQIAIVGMGNISQVKEGKMRPIAFLANARSPQLPDVPTLKEQGVDFTLTPQAFGLWVRAETPAQIVNQLSTDIGAAQQTAEFQKVVVKPLEAELLNEPGPAFKERFETSISKIFRERTEHLGIKLGD